MIILLKKSGRSQSGQGITELALILPLLLLLSLGAIEVANMINSYLTLTHMTREGANAISRGIAPPGDADITSCANPNDALDAIVVSADPVIRCDNEPQWTIIYSEIRENTPGSGDYFVQAPQITRGGLGKSSQVGAEGNAVATDMSGVDTGQTFHAIEVFYEYAPGNYVPGGCPSDLNCPLTPLPSFAAKFFTPMSLPTTFYDMTIFTDVSGVGS